MRSLTFRRYARVILLSLIVFAEARPAILARETFGNWTTEDKACEALAFLKRMREEFAARALRLSEETGRKVDVSMPFVDGVDSAAARVAAEWSKFVAGKMGEASTARWTGRALKEMEGVRKKLAAAEKSAAAEWDKKHQHGRKAVELPPEAQAFIYEMQVNARNLGVILDNSPSMRTVLPVVREEITRRFTGARFLEVGASSLKMPSPQWGLYGEWFHATMLEERNPFDAKWFLPAIPQEEIHYHMIQWKRDAMAAMRSLITLMEVDAIYWFCDFEDLIEPAAVRALSELLTKSQVRLYIHSVKNAPPGSLMNVVRETNGKATRAVPGAPVPATVNPAAPVPAAAGVSVITREFLESNVGTTVRITGTVGSHWVHENYGTVALHLTATEEFLTIRFPDRSFKPTTSRAGLLTQYPVGRVFEATGRLQQSPGQDAPGARRAIFLTLGALSDFKILPEGTPKPAPPAAGTVPKSQPREVDPFRYKEIKPTPLDYKSNMGQPVTVTVRVKSVDTVPGKGHVFIALEGTDLLLGCRDTERLNMFPPTGVRAGDTVTGFGRLTTTPKGVPVLVLEVVKVAAAPGTGKR